MIAIVGFITVILVSAVAIYNYVSFYDNNKKIDGKIATAEKKAKLATEMEHQEHAVELDKAKTEVGVNVLKARREADTNLKSATTQLRNELNEASKTLNKTITDYVVDILKSIGLLRADQQASWLDYSATKADYQATKTDYTATKADLQNTKDEFYKTRKDYLATNTDFLNTKADYQGTKKDYLDTKSDYQQVKADYQDTKKQYFGTKDLLNTTRTELSGLSSKYNDTNKDFLDVKGQYLSTKDLLNTTRTDFLDTKKDYQATKAVLATQMKGLYDSTNVISGLQGSIKTTSDDLTGYKKSNDSRLFSLNTNLLETTAKVDKSKNDLDKVFVRFETVDKRVGEVQTKADTIEKASGALTGRVDAIDKRLQEQQLTQSGATSSLKDVIGQSLTTKSVNTGDLIVNNSTKVNGLTAGEVNIPNGRLRVGRTDKDKFPQGWGSGVHSWDVYANGTVGAGVDGNLGAYMNSAGMVKGKDINADNKVTTKDLDVLGSANIKNNNVIQFGDGITKEANAGKIGYGTFDGNDSLNIVGAGKDTSSRHVRVWDRLTVGDKITANNANIIQNTEVNDVDLKGTLWFGKNDGSSDPYSLRKISKDNVSSLRFTINDDADESVEIWGHSCASGDCSSAGTLKHKFSATGDAQHEGNLLVKGVASLNSLDVKGKLVVNGVEVKGGTPVSSPAAVGLDPRFNSISREGDNDWLRIRGTKDNGTAMYNGVSINEGGLAVGQFGRPAHQGIAVHGNKPLEFGTGGEIKKQVDAGKMGYQVFSDALDIVGAGTGNSDRKVKIWDNLDVGGKLTAGGKEIKPISDDPAFNTITANSTANINGDVVLGGGNNWIVHTPNDNRTDMWITPSGTYNNGDWNWENALKLSKDGRADIKNMDVRGKLTVNGQEVKAGGTQFNSSITTDIAMNDKGVYLRGPDDKNHYVKYAQNVDGPRIQGVGGGSLGTVDGKSQLSWGNDNVTLDSELRVKGNKTINFGSDVQGKETNAGKIGYGTFDNNASLNIVGAGKPGEARKVRVFDKMTIEKDLEVGGKLTVGGQEIKSGGQGPPGPQGPPGKDTFGTTTFNDRIVVNGGGWYNSFNGKSESLFKGEVAVENGGGFWHTHFNHKNQGLNYIRGHTEHENDLNVKGNFCVQGVCINGDHLRMLKGEKPIRVQANYDHKKGHGRHLRYNSDGNADFLGGIGEWEKVFLKMA
jgi:F0F1-type ATP synthase membrane subunit b/b'